MAAQLRPVLALLLSAAVLLMGNGLLGVLVPIRATAEHFTSLDIGIMGSFHFGGLIAGCLICPALIARVGHIRAFTALTAVATITPLAQAIWPHPAPWWVLRMLNGLCFAGLFMVIESWLNGAATSETRGRVLAAYTMLNLTVVTVGMQLIGLGTPQGFELFSLVAVLYSLAAVPVALSYSAAPNLPRRAKLRLAWLFSVSPAAVLGCFFTGLANGAFWTLAPVYGQSVGLSAHEVAVFVTCVVLGGAVTQWPVGQASDALGRRAVILGVAGAAAATGSAFFLVGASAPRSLLFALACAYGAAAMPVYTLCVAHANDLVHRKRAVEVSSGLLLTFSLGAVVGPLLASVAMREIGAAALFLHSAVAHSAIVATMVLRASQRPGLPASRRAPFIPVPRTTPAVFELDPRGEREDAGPVPRRAAAWLAARLRSA
jgi:MFS family permease